MLGFITSWIFGSPPGLSTQDPCRLPGFAQAVVRKLKADADNLPTGPGIMRMKGSFRLYLQSMLQHLDSFSDSVPPHPSGQRRILAVLDYLEGLCQWPSPCGQPRARDGAFDPEQYPTLKSLLESRYSAISAIVKFAAARASQDVGASLLWERLADSFDHLGGPEDEQCELDDAKGPDLFELKNQTASEEESSDNQPFILYLYHALSEHFINCRYQRKSMTINLRLNWWCKEESEDEDILWFSLFFLTDQDSLPENEKASHRWQDTQICVPKLQEVTIQKPSEANQSSTTDVIDTSNFDGTDESSSSSFSAEDDDVLCKYLEVPSAAQLKFVYSTDFVWQGRCQPERPFLRTCSSVPLSTLIGTNKLNAEMKAFLSFHLVRTVWQYYQSDWIRDDWSKDSVHFMFDEKVGIPRVVSVHEPFLQTQFNLSYREGEAKIAAKPENIQPTKQRRKQRHRLRGKNRTHSYPKLLALGIILLEIELDRDFQKIEAPDFHDPDVTNVRHSRAASILKNDQIWPPKGIYKCIKQAIEICIKPDTQVLGDNEKGMRWNFFEEVVGPLETFLSGAWDDAQGMNTIELAHNLSSPLASSAQEDLPRMRITSNDHSLAGSTPLPPCTGAVDPVLDRIIKQIIDSLSDSADGELQEEESGAYSLESRRRKTDSWFQNFIKLLNIHKTGRAPGPRLKVAILDSGINLSHPDFDGWDLDRIKETMTFIGGDPVADNVGHGTHIAATILRLTENVDLYIGKITDSKDVVLRQEIADAIRHARTEWKVDMISLSFGFAHPNLAYRKKDGIHEEISRCIKNEEKPILVFASASNDTGEGWRTWPADESGVICVHSAKQWGGKSDYNPPTKGEKNFSFVGEQLRPTWGRRNLQDPAKTTYTKMNYKSGTSYATPVAVSFAAFIIGFINLKGWSTWTCLYDPRSHEGMERIFKLMSIPVDGCDWVSPTRYLKLNREIEHIQTDFERELGRQREANPHMDVS